LKPEVESVRHFVRTLFGPGAHPDDAAQLISFNWAVTLQQGWTHSARSIEDKLHLLRGEAGTSAWDAISHATDQLERRHGRHVIVIITDGGDTVSKTTFRQAMQDAQMADTVVYPVIIMPITNDAGRNIGGENALITMAAATGGRTFQATVGPDLDQAFTEIINDLRTQYLLGFYPRNVPLNKNRFHKLELRTARKDLRVLARNGYYGEIESDSAQGGGRVNVAPHQE
jgi:Ca-activated chloride channel family protein